MEEPDPLKNREAWLKIIHERKNPFYEHPEATKKIWRYMDLAKFAALLDNAGLYFSRADCLGDPYEGSISVQTVQDRIIENEEVVRKLSEGFPEHVTDEIVKMLREELPKFNVIQGHHLKWSRLWTFVNCWYVNEHESAAMWNLYARSSEAIAIQSTFSKLFECLQVHRSPPNGEPILGLVKYIDYDTEPVIQDVHLSEYFFKRKSYSHERELRAVFQELPQKPLSFDKDGNIIVSVPDTEKIPALGRYFHTNMNELIENIYVAPHAPEWFVNVVKSILSKYGLDKPVKHSALDGLPLY